MALDYDAILLDLDGTVLTPDETILPETRRALKEAEAAGVTVMVATGRSKISGMPIVEDLGLTSPAVFFNGCAIWDPVKGRMIEERTLSNRTNERLHAWGTSRDAQVIVMTADEKLTHHPRSPEEEKNFEGFIGIEFMDREELLREFTIRLSFLVKCENGDSAGIAADLEAAADAPIYVSHFPLSVLPRHRTNPYSAVDVHAPCQGKAEGLRFLTDTRGIPASRIIAIGDADNDVPMLRAAGLGAAMGNAFPEVQEAADVVIGSNDTDAIARLIDERVLS